MQIAEGIFQVQLPLPFPLRIVNCYVLPDGEGWTIIDAGINYPEGRAAWQVALDELGIAPKSIRQIILTHAHPDHYGMAGWLAEQSGAPVWDVVARHLRSGKPPNRSPPGVTLKGIEDNPGIAGQG